MNKTKYKKTFSQIYPSDDTVERILDMGNKKNTVVLKKVFAIVLIIALIICSVGIMADAATNGEMSEKISEVADDVSRKLRVFINGKEAENFELVTETNENGETSYKASIDLPEGYVNVTAEKIDEALTDIIEFEIDYSDSDDGDYVFSGEVYDVIISDSEDVYVPTTSVSD